MTWGVLCDTIAGSFDFGLNYMFQGLEFWGINEATNGGLIVASTLLTGVLIGLYKWAAMFTLWGAF